MIASCLTPYGPGLLAYDVDVARNTQIAQYINEWNSPDFHSLMAVLVYCVPLVVLVACLRTRRLPVLEGSLAAFLFVEALRTQRLVDLPHGGRRRVGGAAPGPGALGGDGAALGRWRTRRAAPSSSSPPRRYPAGTVVADAAGAGLRLPELAPRPDLHASTRGATTRSPATGPPSWTGARTSSRAHVLTEFFAVTDLTTNPDPILAAYHVSYVVWAPRTPLAEYLSHDPRWHVVDRTTVALVFARR